MTISVGEGEFLFTSESVTEGHPDKIADQISDAVLDQALAADPHSRVACETMLTTGLALVAGEITTSAQLDIPEIVRSTIREIGYTSACGFDGDAWHSLEVTSWVLLLTILAALAAPLLRLGGPKWEPTLPPGTAECNR